MTVKFKLAPQPPAYEQGEPVAWTYMHKGLESYSEPHPCLVWASEGIDVMRQGLKTGEHVHYVPRPDLYDWRPLFYGRPQLDMRAVMAAVCSIPGMPILTSNLCAALAARLNGGPTDGD